MDHDDVGKTATKYFIDTTLNRVLYVSFSRVLSTLMELKTINKKKIFEK